MSIIAPPGLEGDLKEYISGGGGEWMAFEKRRIYTNAFIFQEGKILLGYKKRGFGIHKYNGFGGKAEPGETPAEAAARELKEESGIEAPLKHAGCILFVIEGTEWAFECHIYSAQTYTGELIETEEMRPQWFSLTSPAIESTNTVSDPVSDLQPVPYDQMWEDDVHWFPLLLSGQPFAGRADFRLQGEDMVMTRWWFGINGYSAQTSL